MKPGKLITAASRLRCILFHQPEWALYSGGRFVFCDHCQQTYGHPSDWSAKAVGVGDASDEAVMLAKQQVYGVLSAAKHIPAGVTLDPEYSESESGSHSDFSYSPSPSVSVSHEAPDEEYEFDGGGRVPKFPPVKKPKPEPYVDPVLPDGKTRKIDLE
jgi:hypothetical protein